MKGLISALRSLTSLPLPGDDHVAPSAALPWFPLVGLILGLIILAVNTLWLLQPVTPWPQGAAIVMVAAEVYLTRAFHLDGLADWADSFGALGDPQKRLDIMKDSSLGAFGVIALVLMLTAKWIAFNRLCCSGTVIWILPAFVLSRAMMVELATALPYARKEGGTGQIFVTGASSTYRNISRLFCLIFCGLFGPAGLALFMVALIIAWVYGVRAKQRFGGITGDLLGASNEITGGILLMTCALPGKSILDYTGWAWALELL